MRSTSEARDLTEERLREVIAMPLDDLVRLIELPAEAELTGASGRKYRSLTYSFWDMEPDDSELFTRVEVTGRGLRRYQRYVGVHTRMPDDPIPGDADLDVSSRWTEAATWLTCGLIALLLTVPWFVGLAYLISRLI